jgi:hypothetical protein
LFLFIVGVFPLLFAEASLQVFYRLSVGRWLCEWWAIPIYEADPVRVYRLKSNLDYLHQTREFTARYRTDALGIRTDGHTPTPAIAKSNDVFRILALGASITFGWGVDYEDSYIYQIASGLHIPGKRIELLNLGTPAQPISYQLKWLRETGYLYQPDLILQTISDEFESMETDDVLPPHRPFVKNGYLNERAETFFSSYIKRVRIYSAVLFYGWSSYHTLIGAHKAATGGANFYRKNESSLGASEAMARTRRYIDFVQKAATNQPQVAFIYVPLAYVVRPADADRNRHPADPWQARRRADEISSVLQSNGVNVVDPTKVLIEHDKTARMYNLYDIHFTKAGNKVVADYALPRLQEIILRGDTKTGAQGN